jgi:ABC-type glycerol-3-phosphate transport system substrate-binding protein
MGQRGTKANDQWLGLFQGMGGTFIDKQGNVTYGDYREEAIAATEAYIEIFEDAAPDGSESWGFPSVSEHMGAGKGFSAINYNIFYRNMQDSLGDSGTIRQYDTPGGSPAVGSWSLGIPSNINDARSEAAWQFIEWANSFEARKERILNGGSPVGTDTLNDDEVIESAPNLWSNLQELISGGQPISKYPGALEANRSNGIELSAALAGQKSVEDAIDAGIAAVEDAME